MLNALGSKPAAGLIYKLPTFAALTIAAALTLTGCQTIPSSITRTAGTGLDEAVTAKVTGSNAPVAEATIQLYAMKTGGPSEPLLKQTVKSGSDGSFSIAGLYTCPSASAQTYLVATGGTPEISGAVTNNQAALATLLGPCGSITTGAFAVNEVTTMAALSAMMNDLTSMTQIGSTSTTAQLAADYTLFTQLVNPATGTAPGSGLPAGTEVQITKLNALADMLATCVNSKGGKAGDGSACGTLFTSTTTFDGSPVPTDTFMAARGVARDYNLNLAKSLALAQVNPPFTPLLNAAPADWDLKLAPTTATPVISPASGVYPAGTMISITDATPGAVIHFTTDGTQAGCGTPVYTQPFALVTAGKVEASAVLGSVCSFITPFSVYTLTAGTSITNQGLSLTVPSESIAVGSSYQGSLTITKATNVPTVVSLSSSAPTAIAVTPASVTIPAGQTSMPFTYSGAGTGGATLTATASGFASASVKINEVVESIAAPVKGPVTPLAGATIQLYAMQSGGPSQPLLKQTVKTGSDGSFLIAGLYTCPSASAQTYLVATGGTPQISGAVTNNQAALATLLGPCGSITTGVFEVNEVTTMAALSVMMNDLTSMTQIGSNSTPAQLASYYTLFTQLVNPVTGTAPGSGLPTGYEVQITKLYALADMLATCVNSKGGKAGDGSACGTLFTSTTTFDGSPVPTDTFMAARGAARDYNLNLSKSLTLAQVNPPFTPLLSAAPADWDLKLIPTTATPVISPASGTYPAGTVISITDATPGAVIHFTTDGTEATCGTPVYTQPFALVTAGKVQASAILGNVCSLITPFSVYTLTSGSTAKAGSLSLAVPAQSIAGGSSYQGTLTLSGATNVPTVVTLTSSAPGAVAVTPSSLTMPAGQTSLPFTYSGVGVGTATISATASGYVSSSVNVTSTASTGVPASFFGLTQLHNANPKPTVPYGMSRSWDFSSTAGVAWVSANPSKGVYTWTGLDAWLALNQNTGVDLIYTFGLTPLWASSNKTAPGTYGPGLCAPPSDLTDWDNYVTAVAQHAAGRIKYWEMWNEPNFAQTYCGDIPTMVTMVQHANKIIKSIDPAAVILSPAVCGGEGASWLQTFLADGGGAYVDVISFHGYSGGTAEALVSTINYIRSAMTAGGASKLPMWDSEASWGDLNGLPSITDPTAQAAFVAKFYLLHWSEGISRFVWYGWDSTTTWGELWSTSGINPAGVAYGQIYNWMVGATLTAPCTEDSSGDWSCTFSRSGVTSVAVWNSTKTVTAKVSATYTRYQDLTGAVHAIVNNTVTVGNSPILLEN